MDLILTADRCAGSRFAHDPLSTPRAATKALAAARDFNTFLKDKLSSKTSDWRLGKDNYAKKFDLVLASGRTPEQLLAAAEDDLKTVRAEMAKLAAPQTIQQALDATARQHPTRENYMAKAQEMLAQATAFVQQTGLLTLSGRSNLQVVETPEFLRGIYGVGGFNPAPALEPAAGRVLLDHAHSQELVRCARRVEAARV